MLRLKEIDDKLKEIEKLKASDQSSDTFRGYVEHMESLETAYKRERVYAVLRSVDDKEYNDETIIPRGMYK